MSRSIIIAFTLLQTYAFAQEGVGFHDETRYIQDNALAIAIIRPSGVLGLQDLSDGPLANLVQSTGIDPSNVARLTFAAIPTPGPSFAVASLFVVELKTPIDADKLRQALVPESNKIESFFPAYEGRGPMGRISFALPKPNTVVISSNGAVLFSALRQGDTKTALKLQLRAMCGERMGGEAFFAADPHRLLIAVSFGGARLSRDNLTVRESFPKPNAFNLRGWFDTKSRQSLSIELIAPNRRELQKFRNSVTALKEWHCKRARAAADEFVAFDPKFKLTQTAVRTLTDAIKQTETKTGVRLSLKGSLKPVDAWRHVLHSFGLIEGERVKDANIFKFQTNMRNVLLARHRYRDKHKKFPTDIRDGSGKPLLSWRVAVLPHLKPNANELYEQFHLDEPWDSPTNKPLIARMPALYRIPGRESRGRTKMQAPILDPAFRPVRRLNAVRSTAAAAPPTDGVIAIVTSEVPVPWTQPVDHKIGLDAPWKNIAYDAWFGFSNGAAGRIDKADVGNQLLYAFAPRGSMGRGKPKWELRRGYREFPAYLLRDFLRRANVTTLDQSTTVNADTGEKIPSSRAVRKLLQSEDPFVVGTALVLLERHKLHYEWRHLQPLLKSRFDFVRHKAIMLIAKKGQLGAASAIFKPTESDRGAIMQALNSTGLGKKFADKEVLPFLRHTNPIYRSTAGYVLAVSDGKKFRKDIEALLKDKDELVRKSAVSMLKIIDSPPRR